MNELIQVAIIGVGGSVIVAIVTVITQLFITKRVINSEKEKIIISEKTRTREKRVDRIIDAISELLTTSDPHSSKGVDYGRTANLICLVQVLLDISQEYGRVLNHSINVLGKCVYDYYLVKGEHIDNKIAETKALLIAHSHVIEDTRLFLKNSNKTDLTNI